MGPAHRGPSAANSIPSMKLLGPEAWGHRMARGRPWGAGRRISGCATLQRIDEGWRLHAASVRW